jgi:Tfp pilus assembly protein PilO
VSARFASLSSRAQVAVVAAALLLVAILGYFVLISPKRSTAASLKQQTASVQATIDRNRSTGFAEALPAVRSARVFSVAEAMPTQLDTPVVLLQLNQLAGDSGISFDQIQPTPATADASTTGVTDPFAAQPILVKFSGSFYNLLTFLQRVRNLVRVQNGSLFAAGRLLDVTDIAFQEGPKGWPQVQATLTVQEFVPQTVAPTTPAVPGVTDTTTTTTTTTSSPTAAAPSSSGGTS